MANKVIKLISLENIFSHKLKSYIYIHLGQKFLLTSARINSNLILVARNNYTIIFVERTKKKKKKFHQTNSNKLSDAQNCMDYSFTRRGNRIAHRDIRWTEWNRKGRPSIEFLEWRQTAPGSVSGRAHLRFHGSWPSLASKSTSECARKHGKINDMPDTRERGRVAESGVSSAEAAAVEEEEEEEEETPTAAE